MTSKRKRFFVLCVTLLFFIVFACSSCGGAIADVGVKVVLEESALFTVKDGNTQIVERGEDASFFIEFSDGYEYGGDNVNGKYENGVLTVKNVRANKYVVVSVQKRTENYDVTITYHANGGKRIDGEGEIYKKGFTRGTYRYPWAMGSEFFEVFEREGYLPVEYNTKADGSGQAYSLGGKLLREGDIDLYVMWEKESDPDLFKCKQITKNGETYLQLVEYFGSESTVAIPSEIYGLPVRDIAISCFKDNTTLEKVVLNKNLTVVHAGAFQGCTSLSTVYLCDNLRSISDAAFEGCRSLANLRMIAVLKPAYSLDLLSTLVQRIERLVYEHEDRQTIFFYGGSGIYHSLDGKTIDEGLDYKYRVINLGQNANLSASLMLEMYLPYLDEKDILVFAPEFNQFLYSREWHMIDWIAIENFYDVLRTMDIRHYLGVFTSFNAFMNGEVQFGFTPKLRSAGMDYTDCGNGLNEYFTRNYVAETKPHVEFQTETLDLYGYTMASRNFIRMLTAYQKKGIAIYWSFAAVYEGAYTNTAEEFNEYMEIVSQKLGCTLISRSEDHMFPRNLIYDSVVHLTTEGAIENSKRLSEELKKVL